MTGREYIAKRLRIWGLLPLPTALLLLVVFAVSTRINDRLALVTLPLFILGLIVVGIGVNVRVVCPYCSQWIGPILRFGSSPFVRGLPRKIQHCPLCGANFDSEIRDESANQQVERTA